MAKLLRFHATKYHRTHVEPSGLVFRDGDEMEVDDNLAEKLLRDFPENFVDIEAEAKRVLKRKTVKDAPDKSIKDAKTKTKE